MADVPWWGSLLTGFTGGAVALLGQGLTHYLTERRDDTKRKADSKAKALAELKQAYVSYITELNAKARDLFDVANEGQPSEALRSHLSTLIVKSKSDAYFRLRMLENDPKASARVAKIGDLDRGLIQLSKKPLISTAELLAEMRGPTDELRAFQEWLFSERFK
jgi:acyl transferase domain-containing protein